MSRRNLVFRYVTIIGFGVLMFVITYTTLKGESYSPIKYNTSTNRYSVFMNWILYNTQEMLRYELSFFNGSFCDGGQCKLKDLVMKSGGTPQRSLIISTWRSGTTFLGQLINAIPGTYYHYEPLHQYGVQQIRPPNSTRALSTVKDLFKCNFQVLSDYFEYEKTYIYTFGHNTRLWRYCQYRAELCYDPEFTSRLCKLYPFQTMKVLRLRLRYIQEILDDQEFRNLKVILLIRDPRGVMLSRQKCDFCEPYPDCWNLSHVCGDMISDYEAAGRILKENPNHLLVLRYEELALEPNKTSHRILKFLRVTPTKSIYDFLESHTKADNIQNDIVRTSRNVPFKWKNDLDFSYVNEIQVACKKAMHLWGYRMAHNKTHMKSKDFNPLEPSIYIRNQLKVK